MTVDDLDAAHARTVESGVDLDAPRECHLYEFEVRDPHDGYRTTTSGYVGESARQPLERLLEHVYEQPWADTIVGWRIIATYPCKRDVLAAEAAAIRDRGPLFNWEHNRRNPRQVPPREAVDQRHARDRAAGRPEWIPPRGRPYPARPARAASRAPMARRAAPAKQAPRAAPARRLPVLRRNRWSWRLGGWVALSLAMWIVLLWLPLAPHLTVLPSAVGVAAAMVGTCWRWRGRAGWRKSTCEGWATVLWLIAAVAVLYAASSA